MLADVYVCVTSNTREEDIVRRAGIVAVVLAFLLAAAPAVMARSTVTISPLGFMLGVLSGEFETEIGQDALTFGVPVMYWSVESASFELTAFGTGAGVRYYIDRVPLEGFYVGGYVAYAGLRGNDGGTEFSGSALGITGVAGYKFVLNDRFVIDVGAGVGFPIAVNVSVGGVTESEIGGPFGTSFSVGLGIAL
nr:hypothetical protein [Bacillota bacterium]